MHVPIALQFANKNARSDRATVLIAVAQNGMALQYAAPSLRDDRGIVQSVWPGTSTVRVIAPADGEQAGAGGEGARTTTVVGTKPGRPWACVGAAGVARGLQAGPWGASQGRPPSVSSFTSWHAHVERVAPAAGAAVGSLADGGGVAGGGGLAAVQQDLEVEGEAARGTGTDSHV